MRKIGIVGLGLMGASYAQKLTEIGFEVYGYDQDQRVIEEAKKDRVILDELILPSKLNSVDLLILCLYPKDNVSFIKEYGNYLGNEQLITDISGTKVNMLSQIDRYLPRHVRYTSHHPMAGREVSGYQGRNSNMFLGNHFIIVKTNRTQEADIETLKVLAKGLGFQDTFVTSPVIHDQFIAYTSQLTHVLAVALVNANTNQQIGLATGDSYRDLTRIAKINENLWAELFLENKQALIQVIENFEIALESLKKSIEEEDVDSVKTQLKKAKEMRDLLD